jgi:hypothetical protein
MAVVEIPPVKFLSPAYANDSDGIDDDVYSMRCETIGCPLGEHLSSLG